MGDVALNAPAGVKPKRSGKRKKANGLDTQVEAEAKVQRERADAAEARIREMETAPVLITKMADTELSGMLRQKHLMDVAVVKANDLVREAEDSQAVALMMNSAYSVSWKALQKKYGLPEGVDVDWTTGEIFRQKAPSQVDNLKED